MKTDDIRRAFLEFFRSKGHEIVESDSLVPKDDPTLLFTGAGMNQFKDKFLGKNLTYRRAASSQKCLRTADLENVGRTSGHHTFFEMLGNFSFGDYFKKEAISWAWEFFTKKLRIDEKRLWVSVYKDDTEAYDIWKDVIKVPAGRIEKFGAKENFWPSEAPAKGPNGPCGPCSEIFYDYGEGIGCGKKECKPACDCGRFIEVWNLVFTQFDRQSDGSLKPLPDKNIDTGMGLERIASVMQGVKTNFEIDIFAPIVGEIRRAARPVTGNREPGTGSKINAIADHIRAVTFCIADGVMPSNEERGYVVRKLIRRSQKYALDLEIKQPLLRNLAAIVVDAMKVPYPELLSRREEIAQIVDEEVKNFLLNVVIQENKVEEEFERIKSSKDFSELAEKAFNFYDTYGMPYDMLEEIAEKHGLKINKKEFESLLEKQRQLSRSKSKIRGGIFSETFENKIKSLGLKTEFLGYEKSALEARVLAVLDKGEVILDRTPFYGESGGQVGDSGRIETPSGVLEVTDAKKINDAIVHIGKMVRGHIAKDEIAKASIDEAARKKTMANHTATHLLQAVLRKVLGQHVRQTGSFVDTNHLRFDFTHMKKMEDREVERVEKLVNDEIGRAVLVKKEVKDVESAKKEGAIALFGEKYGRTVRVVSIEDVSKELCGGTHVDNTKDIGLFKITKESSIASGVRRIEALTGAAAKEWITEQKENEKAKAKAAAEKEEAGNKMKERLAGEMKNIDNLIASASNINGTKVITGIIDGVNIDILRALTDAIISKEKMALVILVTRDKGRASFVISQAEGVAVSGKLDAGTLAKELARSMEGSGGGRKDFAQGGGKNPAGLEEALKKLIEIVKERLI